MKRSKKLFALIASLCLVLAMGTVTANAADSNGLFKTQANERYAGANRYATSIATADALKASLGVDKFENVVIAYGGNYPDALAGGYLANVKNAPVITVDNTVASENSVKDYLGSNLKKNGTVYILGGTGVVTERFEKALKAEGYSVERLAGANRYDTNLKILDAAGKSDKGLLICSGNGYADSLSASAVDMPILLVNTSITKEQQKFIDAYNPSKVYIVGGTGVVSTAIENGLKAKYDVKRLAGANRYKTSVAVAEEFFDVESVDTITFAYGQNFPDGLSGGPLAAALDAPMILTETANHADAKAYRQTTKAYQSVSLGGTALISDEAVADIMYNYVTTADTHKVLEDKDTVIIDVRKAADYETSHIWNSYAAQVNMADISDSDAMANVEAVVNEVGADKNYVIVCYSGNKYAKAASAVLAKLGVDPRNVYTLKGGKAQWDKDYANDVAKSYTSTGSFNFLNGISVAQAKKDIEGDKDLTIIDVRDAASFEAGHIPGAVNAALCDETKTAYDADTCKAAMEKVVGNNKDGLFAIVCYSGNSYVDKARTALAALGIPEEQVISVEGGEKAWKAAGYTEATGSADNLDTSNIFVDAEWLKKAQAGEFADINPDNLVVAYVSYTEAKAGTECIPGSVNVNNLEVEDADGLAPSTEGEYSSWNAAYNLLDQDTIRKNCLKHGITADTTVVVYGTSTSSVGRQALGYLFAGVKDVKMLGYGNGVKSWKAEGNTTVTSFEADKKAKKFGTPAADCDKYVDTMEDVQKELYGADGQGDNYKTSSFKLVSIRSEAEFNGETSGYGYMCRAGEPEGAVLGYDGIFTNDNGKIKTLAELNADGWENVDFETDGSQHLSFYCGTGWRATIPFLICLEAGIDNVSVYDGGWYEWSMDTVVDFNEKDETKIHTPLHPENRVQVGNQITKVKYLATDKAKGMSAAAVKSGQMTINIDLSSGEYAQDGKTAKVWVPVPESDDNQTISNFSYKAAKATVAEITTDSAGNKALHLEWDTTVAATDRTATVTYYVERTQIRRPNLIEEGTVDTEAMAAYLGEFETSGSLTDGIVKETADKIVADAGAETVLEKAWAIYQWEVMNLHRDNSLVGCGNGDVPYILSTSKSGKCTDLNSTYVALCRAVGVPARESFGVRLNDNATGGEHCRAEFYLPGTGWVQADPADTLKAMLNHEDEYRADADKMNALYKKYFGANDNNWVQVADGRDITLSPAQSASCDTSERCLLNASGTLNNFGYIYGETDGVYMQTYKPAKFGYTMSFDQNAYRYVNAEDVYNAIENDDVVILDTRKVEDYKVDHIPGAVSASCDSEVTGGTTDGTAADNIKAIVKKYGKNKTYYVICYTGNRYAAVGTDLLKENGVSAAKIYTLGDDKRAKSGTGGMKAWRAKYPTYVAKSYTSTKGFDFMNGITAEQLKADVDGSKLYTVVDLRTIDLFQAAHIPGALSAVQRDVTDAQAKESLAMVVGAGNKGDKYVLVCYSGNNFADKARNTMVKELGVDEKDIIVLEGGMGAWTNAGYPTEAVTVNYNYIEQDALQANASEYVIVDTRKVEDYNKGHIANAVSCSVASGVSADYTADGDYKANIKALVDKYGADKKYAIVCYSGNKYAKTATNEMVLNNGVPEENIVTLTGGFNAWKTAKNYVIGDVTVDPVNKTISMDAYVNGNLLDATCGQHYIVNKDGSQAKNSILNSDVTVDDFYNSLVAIAGEKVWSTDPATRLNADGTTAPATIKDAIAQGIGNSYDDIAKFDVTVSFGGNTYAMAETIKTVDETAKVETIFAGNYAFQKNAGSGCLTCVGSCFAGITSGYSMPIASKFTPVKEKLPAAGEHMTVTYKLKKTFEEATTAEVKSTLTSGVVLDARTQDAYAGWSTDENKYGGHIDGAKGFSANWLTCTYSSRNDDRTREERLAIAMQEKGITADTPVVVYDEGNGEAEAVANYLSTQGVKNIKVYNIDQTWDETLVKYSNYSNTLPPSVVNKLIKGETVSEVGTVTDLKIIEFSWGTEAESGFLDGHVPTAVHINSDDIDDEDHLYVLDKDTTLLETAKKAGITKNSTVVVTGDGLFAAHLAVVLEYLGCDKVYIMSGGASGWTDAGFTAETGSNTPTAASEYISSEPANPDRIDTVTEAVAILRNSNAQLVDTRTMKEFLGNYSGYSYVNSAGRPDGAIFGQRDGSAQGAKATGSSMMYYENIDGTMKDAAEIKAMWAASGVDTSKHLSFYCGGGYRAAAVVWYANTMGLTNVSLFNDGWSGYIMYSMPGAVKGSVDNPQALSGPMTNGYEEEYCAPY